MENVMLDVRQLAKYLNISISLVRKLVRNNDIPYNRIGVKLLFSKLEIDKWLKERQNNEYGKGEIE